jgi:hypothetical protein
MIPNLAEARRGHVPEHHASRAEATASLVLCSLRYRRNIILSEWFQMLLVVWAGGDGCAKKVRSCSVLRTVRGFVGYEGFVNFCVCYPWMGYTVVF